MSDDKAKEEYRKLVKEWAQKTLGPPGMSIPAVSAKEWQKLCNEQAQRILALEAAAQRLLDRMAEFQPTYEAELSLRALLHDKEKDSDWFETLAKLHDKEKT